MNKGEKVVVTTKKRNGEIAEYVSPFQGGHQLLFSDGTTDVFTTRSFKLLSEMGSVKPKKPKKVDIPEAIPQSGLSVVTPVLEESKPLSTEKLQKPLKKGKKEVRTIVISEPRYMKASDLSQEEETFMGRPTTYTKETADLICAGLALGKSIRTVLREGGETMPSMATFFSWLRLYPDFLNQYTRAKEEAVESLAEEIMDIADESSNDYMEVKYGKEWVTVQNKEAMMRSKLRIDTRMWIMSKLKPRKYGTKLDVTSDNKQIVGNTLILTDFTDKKSHDETTSKHSL